jgi:hypothetical protein
MTRIIDTVFPSLVAAAAIVALQPLAAAAGPVEGSVTLNGQKVRITDVAIRLHDNAEGVFDRPLVLVFADRPVPAGALDGGMAIGVHQLAREGQLRGLMLRMDPAKPAEASMVLLDKPADARTSLAFASVSGSDEPVIAGLKLGGSSASGSLKHAAFGEPPASLTYALRFDAPLTREPAPTADLQAAALKASPQYKVAAAYAQAMAKGDLKAVRLASSRAMLEQVDGMVAAAGEATAIERMKKSGVRSVAQLAKFKRMVERGTRAMLVVDNDEYLTLVKEGGDWKMGS